MKITFGKYKNLSSGQLVKTDISYATWLQGERPELFTSLQTKEINTYRKYSILEKENRSIMASHNTLIFRIKRLEKLLESQGYKVYGL